MNEKELNELRQSFYAHLFYEVPEVTSDERRRAIAFELAMIAFGRVQ